MNGQAWKLSVTGFQLAFKVGRMKCQPSFNLAIAKLASNKPIESVKANTNTDVNMINPCQGR